MRKTRRLWLSLLPVVACAHPARAPTDGGAVPLLVTLSRYEFSPGGPTGPPIRLRAGVTYEITFHSADGEHGVSAIPLLGIEERIVSPGHDYVVTVAPTIDQTGRYHFACTRLCGVGHGAMHGSIEVDAS
jgi:heme/copper-type cytochrome/quinol oxidase subunit 2